MQTRPQLQSSSGAGAPPTDERHLPALRRFAKYLDERFPPLAHGLLIAAFAGGAVCYSALERAAGAGSAGAAFGIAFGVLLLLFFQLRVADEHKDFDDDRRFRPERAVPRGLISLAALRRIGLSAAALQLGLVLVWYAPLAVVLVACWAWMGLMTVEFFAPAWLKERPVLYLVSHMVAMPLFAFFAVATERLPSASSALVSAGVLAFLALSFANGITIEVARKCKAPEAEREGVETYSALWGPRVAGVVAALAVGVAVVAGLFAAEIAQLAAGYALTVAAAGLLAASVALRYSRAPAGRAATHMENAAGVFVLVSYLALGPAPLAVSAWTS